jgi:hypothetical protein
VLAEIKLLGHREAGDGYGDAGAAWRSSGSQLPLQHECIEPFEVANLARLDRPEV